MGRVTATLRRKLEVKLAERMLEYSNFKKANGEKFTKADKDIWSERIRVLKKPVEVFEVITPALQNERVALGSPVTLIYANGRNQKLIVDGASYTDDNIYVISYNSKVGASLLDKRVGDTIRIDNREVRIEKIEYPW